MNFSSVNASDTWWQDENYERIGDPRNLLTYWIEQNAISLFLALLGSVVSVTWLIFTIREFPNEIRDICSTSRAYISRKLSSLWNLIRKKNRRRARTIYEAKEIRKGEEPQVWLELENMSRQPPNGKRTIPTATTSQRGAYQQQNGHGAKRRTRIKIIDDIYGEIVGYQDSASADCKLDSAVIEGSKVVSEKMLIDDGNLRNGRRRLALQNSAEIQPRCHVKGRNLKKVEDTRVDRRPRANREAANGSLLNHSSPRRVKPTENLHVTPDLVGMRQIACRIQREREAAARARKALSGKRTKNQYEDMVESTV